MKDKRLIITYPLLILAGIFSLYVYIKNPHQKEFDKSSMAMILATCGLIISLLFKREFTRQIIIIIILAIYTSAYFLL